jgi:hypothetical protein
LVAHDSSQRNIDTMRCVCVRAIGGDELAVMAYGGVIVAKGGESVISGPTVGGDLRARCNN